MDYIAQPKDYWIAPNAINITLNALGNPNRTQGSVASGAAILCYIEGVTGLGYDNGHRFKTWPLSISPTYFNSNTAKYVYVAIPRTSSVGTQAVVVFPSEKLDIYGKNVGNAQIGSTDYYYIWLQGIITATNGTSIREWAPRMNFGQKGTDEDLYDDTTSDWYQYSKVSEVVTFLKNITMKAGTTFLDFFLGYKKLTGVATSDIAYTDSDTLVATPGYVESQYLSKTHESEAQEQIGFLKGLWIGVRSLYEITANGIAKLKSVIAEDVNTKRVQTGEIKSPNYTGDGVADTGFRLTNSHNGHSKLTIDELYVRMKAVFESLEVRERTYTGGDQIWSCAGNKIIRVDYLGNVETADHVPQMMRVHSNGQPASQEEQDDVYSVPVPGDTYGYSDVKVPWLLRQMPLLARAKVFARYRKVRIVINEPSASSARRAAAESPLANIRRARCYFLAKDDDMEVHNWWRINDLARCQTMNLANTTRQTYISGEDQKAGNIFWWRKVIGVSYEPVTLDDGKQYHYFDVAFDYEYEQTYPEVMATSVMEGSDIPAAQDSVVQFGNTIIEGRMNLMMMEVNGSDAVGYNPTTDAPCLKAYRGVYCFDLNKSWVGGNPCKMKLSPKTGYEFYGPNFKQVTEYDVVPVPVDRGLWTNICRTKNSSGEYIDEWQFEKDDYGRTVEYSDDDVTGRTTGVRKCYYYDKVSHGGQYWLCSIVDGAHWVDSNGDYITDAAYEALTDEQKALCSRHPNYTIEEPSADSTDWTLVVEKGEKGDTGDSALIIDIDNDNDQFCVDADGKVLVQQTRSTVVSMLYGTQKQAFTSAPTATMKYDDGTSVASSVAEVAVAVVQNTDNKEYRVTVTIKATGANTPVFTATGKNGLYVDIEGTCAKGGPKSIRFSLEKVMSGEAGVSPIIYQLAPTQKGFSFGRDSSNNLTPSSRSSQVNVAKTEGNTTTILTTAQTGITYKWGWDESTTAQATGQAIGTSISVSNTDAASHNQVWVELSTGDRETLPITKDGPKGDTGADAIYANIAPANVLVATSENGVVSTEQTSEHLVEFFKGSAKQNNEFSRIICTIDSITLDSEYHDEYTPRKYYKVVLTRSSGHLTGGLTLSVNSGFTLTSEVMQIVAVMTINGESVSRTLELPIKALRQGEAGNDAIVLKADPENVIITQSTEQQGGSYPFIVVDTWSGTDIFGFTQLKIVDGGTEKTSGFTVGTPVPSKIPGTQTNSCTCTVSGTKVGITAIGSDSGAYATSGYVTIPVTYGGKSYQVVWNFYCNLLGTWKQSVENGVETSISSQLSYELFGDSVHTISQEGQYIRGWAENTSRLSKEIYDSMISDISGWWPFDGDASIIRYDALNLGVIVESNSVYTPVVHLDTGKTYCFAAYFASNPSGGIFAYGTNTSQPNGQEVEENGNELSDYSSVQTTDQSIRIGGTTYYLYYIYFTVQASERYVSIQIAASCYRPRIIEGKTPIVTSLIKQTADEVDMSVRGALGDAGINIIGSTREVNLIAGKVNFMTAGGQTNPKISIDPETGALHAVDGIFDGTVVAKVLKQMVCEAYPSRNEQNVNLLTIDPNGGETIYAEYYHTEFASDDASYAAVYVREHGINVGDIFYVDSTIVSAFTESNFYVNTGFATYVVITDQYYDGVKKYFPVDGTKGIIRIPKPSDCIGMVITFINACDGRNINGNWAQGSAHIRCAGHESDNLFYQSINRYPSTQQGVQSNEAVINGATWTMYVRTPGGSIPNHSINNNHCVDADNVYTRLENNVVRLYSNGTHWIVLDGRAV